MHHTDSTRKLRQGAVRLHGSAVSRVFRAPSPLGIAVAFSAIVAAASLLIFLLSGETTPTHPAAANIDASGEQITADVSQVSARYSQGQAQGSRPSQPFQNAGPVVFAGAEPPHSAQPAGEVSSAPQIAASEIRRLQTATSRVGRPSDTPSDEPSINISISRRPDSANVGPESAMTTTKHTSTASQKQAAPPASEKTPTFASSDSTEPRATEQSSRTLTATPRSPKTQSQRPSVESPQPPLDRPPRIWPKPFTPEEERYRQQVGVQAFINYQHELATGQKRTEE
jgi:hypothetical protein